MAKYDGPALHEVYPRSPASYVLEHIPTGVFYVGSTNNLVKRLMDHRGYLESKTHHSRKLSEVYTQWSDIDIQYEVHDDIENARDMEQLLLDSHANRGLCANVATNARDLWSGRGQPEEVTRRIREAQTGLKHSPERIEKNRQARLGIPLSLQHRQALSKSQMGHEVTAETRAKISASNKGLGLGRKLHQSVIDKGLATKRANGTHLHTDESRLKIAQANHKAVIANGVRYDSMTDVAEAFDICPSSVGVRIRSTSLRFSGWYFAEE